MARVHSQPGPGTTGISSLRYRAFMGSKVFAKFGVSQCSQNFALHLAIALLLALALLVAIAVMIRSS